jgi:hypothetical protein
VVPRAVAQGCRWVLTVGLGLAGLGVFGVYPPHPAATLAGAGSLSPEVAADSAAGRAGSPAGAGPAGICFGAFPREETAHGAGRGLIMFRPSEGLDLLSQETGLRIRGAIVYVCLTDQYIRAFRAGATPHYLPDSCLDQLACMTREGRVLRLSLEPISSPGARGVAVLSDSQDVLLDMARTLAPLGPCSMRVASELNLYDSNWHVPTTSPSALQDLQSGFADTARIFRRVAPNVTLTFSAFMPNDSDPAERRRTLGLILRYLPYVQDSVDMFTGTCYPHSPDEVAGLVQYARLAAQYGKPLGIDELGCWDEATFRRVMAAVTSGELGDLRFINFFDYHVHKPGIDNPWQLKEADKQLLRNLKQQGALVDS